MYEFMIREATSLDKDNKTRKETAEKRKQKKMQEKTLKKEAKAEKKKQLKVEGKVTLADQTMNDYGTNAKKKRPDRFVSFLKRKNTKKNRIILIIVTVLILVIIARSAIKTRNDRMAIFDVMPSYTAAQIGNLELTISGDGNLESGSSVSFVANTDIAIGNVIVQEGQEVKTGDVIATLDEDEMKDILAAVEYDLNDMQATVDASYLVEDTYYIKATVSGRLKDVQVEEEDFVEDVMIDPGYIALISTAGEMKMAITEEEYETLSQVHTLVVKSEGYKYDEDVELRYIDGIPYVIIPEDYREIGAEAKVYSAEATKAGNELAVGNLELVAYEKILGTYGEISYQDDFENYSVDKGEVLFHVDQYKYTLENSYVQLNELRQEYNYCKALCETLTLTAQTDGIMTDIQLADDTTILKDATIATVKSTDSWRATIAVDELDISMIEVGQTAIVTIDALDYAEFPATVMSISSAGSATGGITTYDVVLDVEDNDGFRISMTVTCEIVTQSVENTIVIPSTAVRTSGMTKYVMVKTDRTAAESSAIKQAILDNDYETLAGLIDISGITEASDEKKLSALFALENPVELLYANIQVVEVGIDDGSLVGIVNGLETGDSVLLPIDSDGDYSYAASFGMMGMTGGGGEPGNGGRPSGGGPPS